MRSRARTVSIKDAAYSVMERAYQAASANGTLPANARQVMYAARGEIIRLTGRPWGTHTDQYFTQHLLPDYLAAFPSLTARWDVVFDDRGHLVEPHTGERLGLGTLAVRSYTRGWTDGTPAADLGLDDVLGDIQRIPTRGPRNRYGAVLFVEKEGFDALWDAVDLADRFDLAIMSTKGMSVTAARALVEQLSAVDVPIYVLHDFDKAGFSIVHTLRSDTRRYGFRRPPRVIDLGLRLADVEAMGLAAEDVEYDSGVDPRENLRASGATEAEANYLVRGVARGRWVGQRVELNAMTSDQLVAWVEQKLTAAGVQKVVPSPEVLTAAYRRARALAKVQEAIDEALDAQNDAPETGVPDDLATRVAEAIQGTGEPWDRAVWRLAVYPDSDDGRAEA